MKQNKHQSKSTRPLGLNTVALLKKASEKLNMSPNEALHKAEDLYMQGYTTYPRTESSSYPSSFNFAEVVNQLKDHFNFQQACEKIGNHFNPRKGVDAGDHPPITPTGKHFDGQDPFYNLICRNFLASLLPDAVYEVTDNIIEINGMKFTSRTKKYIEEGWHLAYKNVSNFVDENDAEDGVNEQTVQTDFHIGDTIDVQSADLTDRLTRPPGFLTESQLLSLMEKHQIGTDASMATHIQNICDRNYVKLGPGRTLVPTELGV